MNNSHGFERLSSNIIGAAIAVHRKLGPGFLESIYENALKVELSQRQISYECQKSIEIFYEGNLVGKHRLDMLVENEIVLELKAIKELTDYHFCQLRSYLMAAHKKVGLLLNFAQPTLEIKRIVN